MVKSLPQQVDRLWDVINNYQKMLNKVLLRLTLVNWNVENKLVFKIPDDLLISQTISMNDFVKAATQNTDDCKYLDDTYQVC